METKQQRKIKILKVKRKEKAHSTTKRKSNQLQKETVETTKDLINQKSIKKMDLSHRSADQNCSNSADIVSFSEL